MINKVIGILGGMGPQASCELYRLVNRISNMDYGAADNSSFPHLLIDSLPVPDLISNVKRRHETVNCVRDGARALCRAGATDIIMACNTMHAFQDEIFDGIDSNFHPLTTIVAEAVIHTAVRKVLVLATRTTIETCLYQKELTQMGIDYRLPSRDLSDASVEIILDTIAYTLTEDKIDRFTELVLTEVRQDPKIDAILLACTELPLIFPEGIPGYKTISSLEAAAKKICQLNYDSKC